MTWVAFLNEIKHQNQVALVGPLAGRARPVVMPTVFVDGGADFLPQSEASFAVVRVGDGDSVSDKLAGPPLDHLLSPHKDLSDLAFVLRELPLSITALEMFGFLGGRRDHELANFGEVEKFLRARENALVNFHSDHSVAAVAFSGQVLELSISGLFSVMTLEPASVHISGDCEYKFAGPIPALSSQGLSNVGHGAVRLQSTKPAFVFLN